MFHRAMEQSEKSAGCYLEVLVGQVQLQAQGVHSLRQGPGQEVQQWVCGLTEAGQDVLHKDDLVTHLCLLRTHRIE